MNKVAVLILLAATYGQQTSGQQLKSVVKDNFGSTEGKIKQGGAISSSASGPATKQTGNREEQQSSKGPEDEGDLEAVIRFFGSSEDNKGSDGQNASRSKRSVEPSNSSSEQKYVTTDPEDKSCTTENGKAGKCVLYFLCDKDMGIITDARHLIDLRKRRSADEQCSSYADICCEVPNNLPVDVSSTPTPPTTDELPQVGIDGQGCGWRNPNGVVEVGITGQVDDQAKFGEYPWMAAVLEQEPLIKNEPDGAKLYKYVGGGSLIHPNVVLTAAHHVTGRSQLRVRIGEWDTQTKKEIYPHQDRDVKEVVIHKDFNRENSFNDVALLFLAEPVDMSKPHIGLACLPAQGRRAIAGTRCQVSGWGKNQFGKKVVYSVILKKIEVPAVDRTVCQAQLRKTRAGAYFELHSSFMCAGGEAGKDVCKGDGGSPLVCPIQYDKERYVQNGIVSWGIGCGEDGVPGVYVDVSNFRSWIDDKVAGHGYDTKTYAY